MLHALLEYAENHGIAAEPGFKQKAVRWLLNFSPSGKFLDAFGDTKSKGTVYRHCPDLTQQEMVSAGSGCRHFLVDSLDVVTLLAKDEVDDKLTAKHDYFVDLLRRAGGEIDSLPILTAIAAALADPAALAEMREKLVAKKAKPIDLATVAVADGGKVAVLVDGDEWRDWWRKFRGNLAQQRQDKTPAKRTRKAADPVDLRMRCVLSGELVSPLPTHNKIEGLSDVGGLSMGDVLTSFDKEAFCSYGLEQGANAAMSESVVKTYVTTINELIKSRSHRLAGVKVVYWYSGEVQDDDDVLSQVFDGFDFGDAEVPDEKPDERQKTLAKERERQQAELRARKLLTAIRDGERPDLQDARYFALTLSANSGRVVIRDWMEGPFTDLAAAIDAWFSDLSIVSRDGRRIVESHKFGAVLAAPLRELKDAAGPLVATLWRCAIKRQPIPSPVMAQTLNRVRIDLIQDESPRHARFGLLKAFCIRNGGTPAMTTELNELKDELGTNPAYLCGRVMALLARIQEIALPGVGAGVVQRYYAAASATPVLVLGRLIRNAQIGHLPKFGEGKEGLRIWFERQLADVWGRLKEKPPRVLSLEEQTLFAMGYYHQMASRGGSTESNNTN